MKYFPLGDEKIILTGTKGGWDERIVHTLSVVEANLMGFKYWGYYGCLRAEGISLAWSNDVLNWEKFSVNQPLLRGMRWASAILEDGVFEIFVTKNFNWQERTGFIVKYLSLNGKKFGEEEMVIDPKKGHVFDNSCIWKDPNSGDYYLFYNHTTRSLMRLVRRVEVKVSSSLEGLMTVQPKVVMRRFRSWGAPSIVFLDDFYWMTFETRDKYGNWITEAYYSKSPVDGYKKAENNPILSDGRACASQFLSHDKELFIFYSKQLDKDHWDLRTKKRQ